VVDDPDRLDRIRHHVIDPLAISQILANFTRPCFFILLLLNSLIFFSLTPNHIE
jgi:hypothetical protein